jgi:hypothetical protein
VSRNEKKKNKKKLAKRKCETSSYEADEPLGAIVVKLGL